MKKTIAAMLAIIALVGGVGAGYFLHAPGAGQAEGAPPEGSENADGAAHAAGDAAAVAEHGAENDGHDSGGHGEAAAGGSEFLKLNNQFIVPLIENGKMSAMVLLSLSLEVEAGSKEEVYAVEPKLRDTYLRVMFDHANAGGFSGGYTDRERLDVLRATLTEVSRPLLGYKIKEVLIEEIVRQDT